MEYNARYFIDCGVSSGFGMKDPDNLVRTQKILADNSEDAYKIAMKLAENFADDYLSNPQTGLTTVQLLSLNNQNDQVSFDPSRSIVKRGILEHFFLSRVRRPQK